MKRPPFSSPIRINSKGVTAAASSSMTGTRHSFPLVRGDAANWNPDPRAEDHSAAWICVLKQRLAEPGA